MSDKLSKALNFVKKAKKVIEINDTMTDFYDSYYTCGFIHGGGIHVAEGIEKLAVDLGVKELDIYTYSIDTEPNRKQFTYDGVLFFQLLGVVEKADLIRSGAKIIQLSK